MAKIELTPELMAEIEQLAKAIKSIPDIAINIIIKTGLKEVKEVLNLMPDKTRQALLKDIEDFQKKHGIVKSKEK